MSKKTKIEKTLPSMQSISYAGSIDVSVMQDDRIIEQRKFHNSGRPRLFNFFANCLTGNWQESKSSRPCKIVLFTKNGEVEQLYNEQNKPIFNRLYWTDAEKVSSPIMYDSAVATDRVGDNEVAEGMYAKFHFRVPFLCMVNGVEVYKIGLYPSIITDYAEDLCAYFIIDYGTEPIKVPVAGGNFTIIVDWTLKLQNI